MAASQSAIEGFRLSPAQERVWSLQPPDGPCRRSVCSFKVRARMDQRRLDSALRSVVEQHEILRTRLAPSPDTYGPVQMIAPDPLYCLEMRSLSLASEKEKDAELSELFASECERNQKDEG